MVVGTPQVVDAAAAADLALSAHQGPAGADLVLSSADVFDLGADLCPDPDGFQTWEEGDSFEIRWELGLLPEGAVGNPLADGSGAMYTTRGDYEVEVVASGSVPTEPGEPWGAPVTVPADLVPGQRLVADATCWRMGAGIVGGEEPWRPYYYLPVFTVTAADGSVPTSAPSTSAPGAPAMPAPGADPAAARPGAASYTG